MVGVSLDLDIASCLLVSVVTLSIQMSPHNLRKSSSYSFSCSGSSFSVRNCESKAENWTSIGLNQENTVSEIDDILKKGITDPA